MQFSKMKSLSWVALTLFSSATVMPSVAQACTRTLYSGSEDTVMTGRTMDWMQDMQTDLWAFPRGMARDGAAGPDSPKWVSKYGSVIASAYNIASADGMNEKGLVANMLYLAEADYGKLDGKAPMSIGLWAQYVLDNYATVAEAVDGLQAQPFRIIAPEAAERLGRHAAPVDLGPERRFGDLRIHRRRPEGAPRQAVHGDDQLADLRPAAGA